MNEEHEPEERDPDAQGPAAYDPDEDPRSLDDWMRSAVRDSALWPVLFAGLCILATLGGALIVLALQERNVAAMGALAILLVMSLHLSFASWRRGRRGVVLVVLLLVASSVLGAMLVLRWWFP